MSKRMYSIDARDKVPPMQATLVLGEGIRGYLWIPMFTKDEMHCTISERSMDAIAKAWCKHRGIVVPPMKAKK